MKFTEQKHLYELSDYENRITITKDGEQLTIEKEHDSAYIDLDKNDLIQLRDLLTKIIEETI